MIRTSDSTKFLTAALGEFHKNDVSVPRSATNPFFKSRYADLWTVKASCDPVLNEHGLVITQFPGISEFGTSTLITRLAHVSGEFMEAETPLLLPKDSPQDQGSAITYMRRYAYCAVLGIVADPDDDAEKAMRRPASKPRETQTVAGEEFPSGETDEPITRTGPSNADPTKDVCSPKQAGFLRGLLKDAGYLNAADVAALVNKEAPPWPDSLNNLSKAQASTLIELLKA